MYERITNYLNHYKISNKCLHCDSTNVNRDLYETRYIQTIKKYADIVNISCNDCGSTMQIPITIIDEE
jgi:transcription elongation factor Elf1